MIHQTNHRLFMLSGSTYILQPCAQTYAIFTPRPITLPSQSHLHGFTSAKACLRDMDTQIFGLVKAGGGLGRTRQGVTQKR